MPYKRIRLKMNNKEAVRQFSTIQHLMWQNYHHIADNFSEPQQLLSMAKAQHEIYGVKQWVTEQAPPTPPQPTYPEKIRLLGMQAAGGFNSFKITKNEEDLQELLQEEKMCGYYLEDGFMFLSSGKGHHSNLNHKTPWLWDGNFNFNVWNPEFWNDFKTYLEIHKYVGMDFCAQLWMRKDYTNHIFRNNVNGITDFWGKKSQQVGFLDEEVMVIHRAYARKVMETYKEVYGNEYKPYLPNIKVMNEPAHHGDNEHFHRIMYFHEDIVENVLLEYTDLEHIIVDGTGSEGTIGELKHRHKCPKPKACDRGGWHGKRGYANEVVMEKHGYSKWEHFSEMQRIVNSPIPERVYTEDGAWDDLGTVEEQGYMMKQLALVNQASGFRPIFKSFPHEALKKIDGVFFPDYRVSEMQRTFACAKAMQKEYWKVMG